MSDSWDTNARTPSPPMAVWDFKYSAGVHLKHNEQAVELNKIRQLIFISFSLFIIDAGDARCIDKTEKKKKF